MAIVRYTLLRVLLFAAVAALLWLAGFRGYVLLLAAIFLSGVISVVALRRSRDAVSAALDARLSAIKERAAAEDAWDDERRDPDAAHADRSGRSAENG